MTNGVILSICQTGSLLKMSFEVNPDLAKDHALTLRFLRWEGFVNCNDVDGEFLVTFENTSPTEFELRSAVIHLDALEDCACAAFDYYATNYDAPMYFRYLVQRIADKYGVDSVIWQTGQLPK